MKILKKANGKQTIKLNKKEWENIGKLAKWEPDDPDNLGFEELDRDYDPDDYSVNDVILDPDDPLADPLDQGEIGGRTLKEIEELEKGININDDSAELAQKDVEQDVSLEMSQEQRIEELRIKEEEARTERERLEKEQMRKQLEKEIELAQKGDPIA
jgi:hypothetical protein